MINNTVSTIELSSEDTDSRLSLSSTLTTDSEPINADSSDGQNIRVAVRIRPLSIKEIKEQSKISITSVETSNTVVIDNKRTFDFDAVFGPTASQHYVYEKTAGDLISNHLFKGFNVTVLAYGQTGSGKTHTIGTASTSTSIDENDGILSRAIEDVFKFVHNIPNGNDRVNVELSFLEIYNEEVRDLLSADGNASNLIICESKDEGVYVKNLTRQTVKSRQEVNVLLDSATERRVTAATLMNLVSSRSHAICTLYISIAPITVDDDENGDNDRVEDIITAKLCFVDLAGSERLKKTGAEGTRMVEGININKGLFTLGQVVSALSQKGSQGSDMSHLHIKYRDSKLTRLLQDSLGGNSKTVMIACISPSDSNVEESLNTLRYAERTRCIKNSAVQNLVPNNMSPAEAAALRRENQMLKLQLFQAKEKLSTMSFTTLPTTGSSTISSCSESNSSDLFLNDLHGLDVKSLDIVTKLRLNCTALHEKVSQLEIKALKSTESLLEESSRADKWQLRCEELMTILKSNDIPFPEDLINVNRLQSLNIVNELRKELLETKESARLAEIDAEVCRATAAAILNGKSDADLAEKIANAGCNISNQEDGQNSVNIESIAESLASIDGLIERKEDVIYDMNREKLCFESMRCHFEDAIKSLQLEVDALSSERDGLIKRLGLSNSDSNAGKMRERMLTLETRIRELKQKVTENSRNLQMKDSIEKKCRQLEEELTRDKRMRSELQRKLKEESQQRRLEKKDARLHASKLLKDSQRVKLELQKVKEAATKQATVLKRKVAEVMNKQKVQVERQVKRSRASLLPSDISKIRRDEIEDWLEKEINSALTLKEIETQIYDQSQQLEGLEIKKKQWAQQNGDSSSSYLRALDNEIQLRKSIIQQLENNIQEVYKASNRNPNVCQKSSDRFLDITVLQSFSRTEHRLVLNASFEKFLDAQHELNIMRANHNSIVAAEVTKALDDQKRISEKNILQAKVNHSKIISELLESTRITVESKLQSLLSNHETGFDNAREKIEEVLQEYFEKYRSASNTIQHDLKLIKDDQEKVKKTITEVANGIILRNEVKTAKEEEDKNTSVQNDVLTLKEPCKNDTNVSELHPDNSVTRIKVTKQGKNRNTSSQDDFQEEILLLDETFNYDTDDSEWYPDKDGIDEDNLDEGPVRKKRKSQDKSNNVENEITSPGSQELMHKQKRKSEDVVIANSDGIVASNSKRTMLMKDLQNSAKQVSLVGDRLVKNLERLKVQELKSLLRERGLTISGKKAELIARLQYNAEAGSLFMEKDEKAKSNNDESPESSNSLSMKSVSEVDQTPLKEVNQVIPSPENSVISSTTRVSNGFSVGVTGTLNASSKKIPSSKASMTPTSSSLSIKRFITNNDASSECGMTRTSSRSSTRSVSTRSSTRTSAMNSTRSITSSNSRRKLTSSDKSDENKNATEKKASTIPKYFSNQDNCDDTKENLPMNELMKNVDTETKRVLCDKLTYVTNSAQKRKSDRKLNMKNSVQQALLQFEALENSLGRLSK